MLVEKMYELIKKPYIKTKNKNEIWKITRSELLLFKEETLGFHLGCFLLTYGFEMEPYFENHDVFHVLTKTGITVVDEIGMQFLLLGNGKRSLFLWLGIILGVLFYWSDFQYFKKQYQRGKTANRFFDLNFEKLLNVPINYLNIGFGL